VASEVLPGCSPARANAPPRSHSSLFGLNGLSGLRLVEALQRRRLPTENGSASAASRSAERSVIWPALGSLLSPAMIPVGRLGEPPRPPRWVKSHAASAFSPRRGKWAFRRLGAAAEAGALGAPRGHQPIAPRRRTGSDDWRLGVGPIAGFQKPLHVAALFDRGENRRRRARPGSRSRRVPGGRARCW
jgi:hypothetical protein